MRAGVLESVAPVRKRNGTGRVKLVLLTGLCLIWLAPQPVHAQAEWELQMVDSSRKLLTTTERSLRFDAGGFPHIVSGGRELEHAWYDGAVWRKETVDDPPQSDHVQEPSLAIDESGNPHISYLCNGLKYAYWNGIEWHTETVDSLAPSWSHLTSLALDGNGYPHISYNGEVLKYAYWDGSDWHKERLEDDNLHAPLILDDADSPHLCYVREDTLKHLFQDGSGWHREVVYAASNSLLTPSMVLDETGSPHISFQSLTADWPVLYAHKDESGWQAVHVAEYIRYWANPSIALDGSGYPHISYAVSGYETGSVLNHAAWDGTEWNIQTVVPAFPHFDNLDGDYCDVSSLAIDGSGTPCISFRRQLWDFDGFDSNVLGFAQWNGESWDVERVDGDGSNGVHSSIALDQSGHPHIAYQGNANESSTFGFGNLQYAYWDGSEWLSEAVDHGIANGNCLSLALDVSDRPHISYRDQGENPGLKYAYRDESGWNCEIVVSGDCSSISLAIDCLGFPHVSYYFYEQGARNRVLQYTRRDESGWHFETVDVAGSYGSPQTCLTLDTADNPHISYGDPYLLKYTSRDTEGWHIQTVDPEAWDGDEGSTSLAMDAVGFPHISYISENSIRHARWTGSDWQIETIDSTGTYYFPSVGFLALDNYGFPHVTYSLDSPISIELRYAYWNGSDWHIESVMSADYDLLRYSSLALDDENLAHISFTAERDWFSDDDLRYARRLPGSINMSIAQDNGQLILSWNGYPGANAYWIYGAANLPYFVPGVGPGSEHRLDIVPPAAATWQTTNGLLDPENNWTYIVLAVDETEQELTRSNRVGEHDFQVDIP